MADDPRQRKATPLVLVGPPRAARPGDAPQDRLVALVTLAAALTQLGEETATAAPAPSARVSSLAALAGDASTPARALRVQRVDGETSGVVPPPVTLRPTDPDPDA
jgi:hypothetical protein